MPAKRREASLSSDVHMHIMLLMFMGADAAAETSAVALGTCESAVLTSWNRKRNLNRIRIMDIFSWENFTPLWDASSAPACASWYACCAEHHWVLRPWRAALSDTDRSCDRRSPQIYQPHQQAEHEQYLSQSSSRYDVRKDGTTFFFIANV